MIQECEFERKETWQTRRYTEIFKRYISLIEIENQGMALSFELDRNDTVKENARVSVSEKKVNISEGRGWYEEIVLTLSIK